MTDRRFCDGCGKEMQNVNSDRTLTLSGSGGGVRATAQVHLHGGDGHDERCLLLWALDRYDRALQTADPKQDATTRNKRAAIGRFIIDGRLRDLR